MENQFVPYELAVKLKELGFDERCLAGYYNDGKSLWFFRFHKNSEREPTVAERFATAPLWQQAFDWLLWKLKHISIDVIYSTAGCELIVEKQKINKHDTKEDCLEKLIELCKKN